MMGVALTPVRQCRGPPVDLSTLPMVDHRSQSQPGESVSQGQLALSVVSPVYGSPSLIPVLCQRIRQSLEGLAADYEVILVFDCSPDDGWEQIQEQCRADSRIKALRLARNFGQHTAILAGLHAATGQWVVVMDCDLQDQPEEIPKLYRKALEGFDVVLAQREERQDGLMKRTLSGAFHRVLGYLADTPIDPSVANFGIYHRKVIRAVLQMGDAIHYFPLMVRWVGFHQTAISVEHAPRTQGSSGYSLRRRLRLAEKGIVSFSDKPLRLTAKLGFAISGVTVLMAGHYLLQYFRGRIDVHGYTSLILSVWFLGGAILFALGMTGIYLSRVFDQVKQRPNYIVSEKLNLGLDENSPSDDRSSEAVEAGDD